METGWQPAQPFPFPSKFCDVAVWIACWYVATFKNHISSRFSVQTACLYTYKGGERLPSLMQDVSDGGGIRQKYSATALNPAFPLDLL